MMVADMKRNLENNMSEDDAHKILDFFVHKMGFKGSCAISKFRMPNRTVFHILTIDTGRNRNRLDKDRYEILFKRHDDTEFYSILQASFKAALHVFLDDTRPVMMKIGLKTMKIPCSLEEIKIMMDLDDVDVF